MSQCRVHTVTVGGGTLITEDIGDRYNVQWYSVLVIVYSAIVL